VRPAFVFQRQSANEQRRLFAGPLVPRLLARRGLLPVLPLPEGLRVQAVHATELAEAFRRVVLSDVRGAFNIAASPVLDAQALGEAVHARPIAVPRRAARAAMAMAWHLGMIPADPALFDLAIDLPLMSTDRAERDLGWSPRRTAVEAVVELVEGVASGAGGETPPLAPDSPSGRLEEARTGVGRAPMPPR